MGYYSDKAYAVGLEADNEITNLKASIASLQAELATANTNLTSVRAQLATALARIAELENSTTPPPAAFKLVATNVQATSFRLSWENVPAGTTSIVQVRDNAGGGDTSGSWTGTDAYPAVTYRDYLWLVAQKKYTITATAQPSGQTATLEVALPGYVAPTTPTNPPASTGNKYGFMVFLGEGTTGIDKDIAGIVEAGGGWARLGMYTYNEAAGRPFGTFTSAGVFQPQVDDWNIFEYACKKAKAAGLKVIWDAADTSRISNTLTDAQWITWQKSMWKYMATRLGPWVDAWQVFNEHDGRNLRTFAAQDNTTAANGAFFRAALEGARAAIREGGSTGPVGTTTFGYPMNEARIQQWFKFHDLVSVNMDYIGVHAYPEFNGTFFTQSIQRVYDRYNKPVAVLEFGLNDGYANAGDGIVIENDALLAVKDKLLCVALFSLRNRGANTSTNGEDTFGILFKDWAKKSYWQKVVTSIAKWK